MPNMDFRETNYKRISELRECGYSDSTIASIVTDELKMKMAKPPVFTGEDINSYIKVTDIASEVMLVSHKNHKTLKNNRPSGHFDEDGEELIVGVYEFNDDGTTTCYMSH